VVVVLFAALLWSGVAIVWRSRDTFSFLLGSGVVFSLAFQAAFNIAVVTGSAPTKGISLPFLTFGGSGLCVTLAQVGLLLSLDRENRLAAGSRRFLAAGPQRAPAEVAGPGTSAGPAVERQRGAGQGGGALVEAPA
jgi:hypothetical protein